MATQGFDIIQLRLKQFVERHLIFKGFIWSQQDNVYSLASKLDEYPILAAYPIDSLSRLNNKELTVGVRVLDIKKVNRSNEASIIHNTELLINDLRVFFGEENSDEDLYLVEDPVSIVLNNVGNDKLDGWETELVFDLNQFGLCEVPLDPVSTDSIIPKVFVYVNGVLTDTVDILTSETDYRICIENSAGIDVLDTNLLQQQLQFRL